MNLTVPVLELLPQDLFFQGGQLWIIYTDYDNFLVYFNCYETEENICTRPGAAFLARSKKPRHNDLKKGQDVIKDLCIKPKRFLDKIQDVNVGKYMYSWCIKHGNNTTILSNRISILT